MTQTTRKKNMCGDCKHSAFGGRSHMGVCNAEFEIPMCFSRFLPKVGEGTIRSVDYSRDGHDCQLFERR